LEPAIVGGLLAVFALVAMNAYFVASEFSLVAVRRSQIRIWQGEGRRGAGAAARAIDRLDDAIAATQLGITLASIGLGFLGEPVLARLVEPVMGRFGPASGAAAHTAAVGIAFAVITFIHVVAGELAPKALALDRPGPVALWCAAPLLWFARLTRPALWLMNGAGNALVRAFGVQPAGQAGHVHSSEELHLLVEEASESGEIREDTGRMLGNVFDLGSRSVRDVMVPRDEVFAVPSDVAYEELLDQLCETGFTRLPVYDGTLDNVIGVLHAKDLFHLIAENKAVVLQDAIRAEFVMPPELSVRVALARFRRERRHLAVVREGDGPVLGVVTLEDVIEEIVGEIEDEHDEPVVPQGSAPGAVEP
jgi:CBS domain containing-hemolysin-like protein